MWLILKWGFKSRWSCPAWSLLLVPKNTVEGRKKKALLPSPNIRAKAPSIRLKNWSLEGRESWNQFGFLIPHEALIPALTFSNELKRL